MNPLCVDSISIPDNAFRYIYQVELLHYSQWLKSRQVFLCFLFKYELPPLGSLDNFSLLGVIEACDKAKINFSIQFSFRHACGRVVFIKLDSCFLHFLFECFTNYFTQISKSVNVQNIRTMYPEIHEKVCLNFNSCTGIFKANRRQLRHFLRRL